MINLSKFEGLLETTNKKLDRIIELLEDAAEQETYAYPITGSVSWTGTNLDDWQECSCGRLVPPDGHCDCPGPHIVDARQIPGLMRER